MTISVILILILNSDQQFQVVKELSLKQIAIDP